METSKEKYILDIIMKLIILNNKNLWNTINNAF